MELVAQVEAFRLLAADHAVEVQHEVRHHYAAEADHVLLRFVQF